MLAVGKLAQRKDTAVSPEEIVAIHRRYNDEVLSQGELSLIDDIMTPDYVDHWPGAPDLHGPGALRQFIAGARRAFPDAAFTVEDRVVAGDRIAVRWTLRATHRDEFLGAPPTNRLVTTTGVAIHRFRGGMICESWDMMDTLGLLQQMGAIPAPAQTASR